MGRVALVTGGTRGIGAAISKALKKAGYNVAANYAGNDEAANAFKKETKIPVFKWDVGDYVACEQGIVSVENEVGPVEVLVNNAGISRDSMLQKMTHEQWEQVIRTNLDSLFNMTRPVINGMRDRGFGSARKHVIDQRPRHVEQRVEIGADHLITVRASSSGASSRA